MRCIASSASASVDRLARPRGGRARELERVQRGAGVAAGARGEELDHVVGDRAVAALARVERAPQQPLDLLGRQRAQLVDLRAREQRVVDLEVRVLGGGADQRHQALLDRGQQRVLLGLVEAVDLVEEEDRRGGRSARRSRARSITSRTSARPGVDGRELLEGGVGVLGGEPRERGLAGARAGRTGPSSAARRTRAQSRSAEPSPSRCSWPTNSAERARAHPRGQRPVAGGSATRASSGGSSGASNRRSMAAQYGRAPCRTSRS